MDTRVMTSPRTFTDTLADMPVPPTRTIQRVLVTGSRAVGRGYDEVGMALLAVLSNNDGKQFTVVHGGCPTGVDAHADDIARTLNLMLEVHPANWGVFGRAAGPVRNQEMVDKGADMCLAFPWRDSYRGTADCMRRAALAGITVYTEWL